MSDKDDALYWQLRRENDEFLRRQQWRHYNGKDLKRIALAREAEQIVSVRVQTMGYQVHQTTYKAPFDLWVQDGNGRAVRLEVKISLYHLHKRGGRYQANVRHDQADLLVFIARNGKDWPFIIPMTDITPRRNITIWSCCPGDHTGRWAKHLDAWDNLHRVIEQAEPRPWQPSLFEV